jgi:hypothetical protein
MIETKITHKNRRKKMKQAGKWIGIVLAILLVTGGQALAQNGSCSGKAFCSNAASGENGNGSGNGECQNIRSRIRLQILSTGEPVTITGTVTEALYAGKGLTVDTGTELVNIFGFGPQFYWDNSGITKPDVGEEVVIDALEVTFSDGTAKIIATSVTIDEDVVLLRDEDGRPLWRRAPKKVDEEL